MNRYKYNKPSLATADTLCQKCLKKGHYSYECTAAAQDRPYVPRPSRMQQFLNPKLAPKITEAQTKAKTPAQGETPSAEVSKRKRSKAEPEDPPRKRSRSVSSSSSHSISTISTNRSRSPSRSPPNKRRSNSLDHERRFSRSGDVSLDRSRKIPSQRTKDEDSFNSLDREVSDNAEMVARRKPSRKIPERSRERHSTYRDRTRSRSRSPSVSLSDRTSRSRSRSPYRRRDSDVKRAKGPRNDVGQRSPRYQQVRERSPSPYSKRVALTRGKNQKG